MRKRLFCLPYAGGGATVYRDLGKYLKSSVSLCALDYPGHGIRMGEKPVTRMDDLLDDVYAQMFDEGLSEPFALLGYSLGSTVAYYLYFYLAKRGMRPQHLFFMANTPPYVEDQGEPMAGLDDKAFLDEIVSLGGMPQEVLECQELLELFLPILRADVCVEEGSYAAEPTTIDCNMSVLYGKDDPESAFMEEWRRCAGGTCRIKEYPGDHFFLFDHYEDVAQVINRAL